MVRRIGSGLLALAALVVWVAMAPEEPSAASTASHDRLITQALDEFEVNNDNAQGAPQQQVVNGWVARDLLSIVAAQQNDLIAAAAPESTDPRVPALLTLAVVGLALLGATTPAPAGAVPATARAGKPLAGGEPWTTPHSDSTVAADAEDAAPTVHAGPDETDAGQEPDRSS